MTNRDGVAPKLYGFSSPEDRFDTEGFCTLTALILDVVRYLKNFSFSDVDATCVGDIKLLTAL